MEQEMAYVYTVYQEGSVSKAAEKLFISQPALSIAIRRVESRLNSVLFDRSQYPLKLTNVGELYIQKYHEIKLLEKELASQINDIHELNQGELVIGGTHFILSYVLAPVLSAFSSRYPNIVIRLYECSSSQLESLLTNGNIDLCLKCDNCTAPSMVPIDDAFRDHLLMAVPKAYVQEFNLPDVWLTLDMVKNNMHLNGQTPCIDIQHLAKLPYLVLTAGNNLRERFIELFDHSGIKPNIKMQIEQIATAYHLADNGMGATLTSEMIIKNNTCHNLVFYLIDSPLMIRDFKVIGRHKRYISNANAKFIQMLKEHYF